MEGRKDESKEGRKLRKGKEEEKGRNDAKVGREGREEQLQEGREKERS